MAQRTQKEVFSVYIQENSQSSPYRLKIKPRSGLKQTTCHDSYSSEILGLPVRENLPGICLAGSECVPNYPETKASPELHLGLMLSAIGSQSPAQSYFKKNLSGLPPVYMDLFWSVGSCIKAPGTVPARENLG